MTKKAAIIGIGFMGSSLAKALRRAGWRVTALTRTHAKAVSLKRLHLADRCTADWKAGLADVSTVLITTPISAVVPTLQRILPWLEAGTLVMDISSVKGKVLQDIPWKQLSKKGVFFVGAHPMTGSEKTGPEQAESSLFQGAACVLTPVSTPSRVLARAKALWKSVGAKPLEMTAQEHDTLVASTSHLPHLVASALVDQVFRVQKRHSRTKLLLAGSFRDATRVALADSDQWKEIFQFNQKALRASLAQFKTVLRQVEGKLNSPSALRRWLFGTRRRRTALYHD